MIKRRLFFIKHGSKDVEVATVGDSISDSAVGADRKRDGQSFRSEVDRFLPLGMLIDQRCFEGMLEFDRDRVVDRKIILKLRSRTPSAAPRLRLASGTFGFNCRIGVQSKKHDKRKHDCQKNPRPGPGIWDFLSESRTESTL
jgi:hypothetical protein